MKYVLLFAATGDDVARYDNMSAEDRAAQYARVGEWFARNGAKIRGGNQLAHPTTATTVRIDGGGTPLVTDGPFIEGNEVLGGYAEIEVDDLDQALQMAESWPPGGAIEVRPVWESPESPNPAES